MVRPNSIEKQPTRDFSIVRRSTKAVLVELLHETGRSKPVWVPLALADFRDYERELWLPLWFIKRYRIKLTA